MKIIKLPKKYKSLLHFYASKGGVIDYICLESEPGDTPGYELYESAVKLALSVIEQETNHPLDADYTHMKGHKITLEQFVGSHFSFERNALVVRGKTSPHLNDYFIAGDAETPSKIVRISEGDYLADGYAAAFANPPYPMQLDATNLNQLFIQINGSFFGGLIASLEIYDWSGTWSKYFEAGAEWWGAYLWTVFNKDTHQLVTIGASSTD